MAKDYNSEMFKTREGTKYKRTISEGKIFWYVSHDDGESWRAISGCPSVVLYPV